VWWEDRPVGIAYRCDAAIGCTFVVWHEDVTPNTWRNHVDALMADPAFPPGPLFLADLRTAGDAPGISTDVVREIGARLSTESDKLGGLQLAIISDGAWDKARQLVDHDVSVSGLRAIVFSMSSAACAWLGLEPQTAERILNDLRSEMRRTPPT
jgi:hypothetical protein